MGARHGWKTYPYEVVRERVGDSWRHGYRATCAQTGVHDTVYSPKLLPPEAVLSMFKKRGWQVHERRAGGWISPKGQEAKERIDPMSEINKLPPQTGAPAPDPKLLREIMLALGDAFDPDTGKWSAGKSDESVAKEVDCAVAVVTRVRRQYFGEEAVPAEMTALKNDLDAARGMLRDLSVRVDAALAKYR
jgi:hypothetical protein